MRVGIIKIAMIAHSKIEGSAPPAKKAKTVVAEKKKNSFPEAPIAAALSPVKKVITAKTVAAAASDDSSSDSELEEAKYNLSWYDYHHYDLFNYDSLFYAIKCFYCLLKSKIKDNKKLLKQYNNLISKFILNKNNYKSKLLHLLLDKKDIDLIFTFEFDFEEKYYFLMHNLYNDTEEYYKNYIEYSDIFINYINDIILNLTKKNIEFITDKYNYDIVISSITRLGKYVC